MPNTKTRIKTYQRSHPHISFTVNLRDVEWHLWMLLGEAQSKIDHIAGVPLQPEVAEHLHCLYLAKGALATTAIEGNTLSIDEAIKRVEGHLDLPPSREYLGQEIDNIVDGANQIFHRLYRGEPAKITYEQILEFNAQVLRGLKLDDGVTPGVIRTHDVGVGSYSAVPHQECEELLRRLCDWLNGPDFIPQPGWEISWAIIKAVVAHLYLAWIHPFGDGNGRTARLVEFQILVAAGVPLPAAHVLSDHYNMTRTEYYRQLDRSSKHPDGLKDFLAYALRGFVDSLKEQLDLIRKQQMRVTWLNYVHETLGRLKSVTEERRRHLVLDLTAKGEPVPVSELPNVSVRVAREYTNVSERTLARDVKDLIDQQYLVKVKGGVRANEARITAFLPARRVNSIGRTPDA